MDRWNIAYSVDLNTGQVSVERRGRPHIVKGDKNSICWSVELFCDGEPADISGCSCTVDFIRFDKMTVPVAGSVAGNVCTAILSGECFAVTGKARALMRITGVSGETILTAACLEIEVEPGTGEYVDPGESFPDIHDFLAELARTEVNVPGYLKITKGEGEYTLAFEDGETLHLTCTDDDVKLT